MAWRARPRIARHAEHSARLGHGCFASRYDGVRAPHALGVIQLHFDGWAQRDETAQFLWDLLSYKVA